jgi:hypothetical protein
MTGDADLASRRLRGELIAASPLCAAIFEAWPDAAPRVIGDTPLIISWFSTGMPQGPAIGDPESITWRNFVQVCSGRRKGGKDGPGFVPARFKLEPDDKHVRRVAANLVARTAVAIDCETNKTSGEVPPPAAEAAERVRKAGWAGVIYTSHNHTPVAPRYRILLPLAEEIDSELPAVEAVADELGLTGVIDRSKTGTNSLFYLPSANPGELERHETIIIKGARIDTAWICEAGGKLLAERQAQQDRIAAEARAQAEARRQARIAAGFDADDSLIEKIRAHLDLEQVLLSHGYDKRRMKFRHPNSTSGAFGADIKTFGGIERVYSHNSNDLLHRDNLPEWCGGVTALDSFDALAILEYGGDRKKAMRELAERYGLTKRQERKTLARLLFRLIREQATQEAIEAAALAEGQRLGLTAAQVRGVAHWVAARTAAGEGA